MQAQPVSHPSVPAALPTLIVETYQERTPRSAELYARALKALPAGDTRTSVRFDPYPVYINDGEGSRITDVDGNTYVDLLNNYTSLVLGHRHPAVMAAIMSQLSRGTSFSAPTESQIELSELLRDRVPSVDRVRFCNSGTEANMLAIRAARAYTGRTLIAKMEGGYHGSHELLTLGAPGAFSLGGHDGNQPLLDERPGGIPAEMEAQIVLIPYNDVEGAKAVFERWGPRLAAVIAEPLFGSGGAIPAEREFLQTLRDLSRQHGAVLIFDEVMTFRFGPGGAQALLGIKPDLTSFGKLMGGAAGGAGAVGGAEDIMAVFKPNHPRSVPHAGTFNGNPIITAAGAATLRELTPDVYERMNGLGDRLRRGLRHALSAHGIRAQVTGAFSMLNIHFTSDIEPITSHRQVLNTRKDVMKALHLALLNRGYMCAARGMFALSAVNTPEEMDGAAAACEDALGELKPWIAEHAPELLERKP